MSLEVKIIKLSAPIPPFYWTRSPSSFSPSFGENIKVDQIFLMLHMRIVLYM
jgi:hypothetical protein